MLQNISGYGDLTAMSQGSEAYLVIILFIVLLQLRERRVKMWTLLIMPILMLLVTIPLVYVELSQGAMAIALLALGFVVGSGIGAAIGSMMEVKVDEKDGAMRLKGSVLAVILWGAIIVVKLYGKSFLGSAGLVDVDMLTSIFLMVTLGMMLARRAVVYSRYLKMKKVLVAVQMDKKN